MSIFFDAARGKCESISPRKTNKGIKLTVTVLDSRGSWVDSDVTLTPCRAIELAAEVTKIAQETLSGPLVVGDIIRAYDFGGSVGDVKVVKIIEHDHAKWPLVKLAVSQNGIWLDLPADYCGSTFIDEARVDGGTVTP